MIVTQDVCVNVCELLKNLEVQQGETSKFMEQKSKKFGYESKKISEK